MNGGDLNRIHWPFKIFSSLDCTQWRDEERRLLQNDIVDIATIIEAQLLRELLAIRQHFGFRRMDATKGFVQQTERYLEELQLPKQTN